MSKQFIGGLIAIAALVAILFFGRAHQSPVTPPTAENPTYHRVESDGGQGPAVQCSSIRLYSEGMSEAELQRVARQYGVTVDVVRTWYVCIHN